MNDILAALDNVLNDGQAHQMTQEMFKQPPGAAITDSHSLTGLRQASFHQSVPPSTSHSTLGTGINHLSHGRPSSHSRAFHADAGLYAGMSQLALKLPSEPAQSTPLPVPLNASLLSPPSHPQRSPEPAPWSLRTRSSGADADHVENAQISMIMSPFPGHPVDLVTASLSAGPGYPGALSQVAGHIATQQATPPASPDSQLTEQHPTGKRRRLSVPKDPRAAKRLRSQRQGDDENLEALYKLLVPRSAGMVQKKDRLGMILRYARKRMQTQGGSREQSTTLEQTRDYRSTSPSQQGEPMESS
ncbi:hypothetical protein BGY98DRAFT_989297 [Russula aff. rugulosa BPL654]|nr:hypothetical protein BGY98DRAFT_989297 [Russula aff. rugulosa BPL654]